jgi:hypothetical protein
MVAFSTEFNGTAFRHECSIWLALHSRQSKCTVVSHLLVLTSIDMKNYSIIATLVKFLEVAKVEFYIVFVAFRNSALLNAIRTEG